MRSSMFVLLGLLAVGLLAYAPCNATHIYLLSGTCYMQCPWNPPTVYYSYLPTYTCESVCPSPYYGFSGNQSCVSVCPTSPNSTYYDYVNRKCVTTCPANYYAAANQSCLTSCPAGTWGVATQWICVSTCPTNTYYANVTVPLCVTVCPANYYAYPNDRLCYLGGSCPTSPVRYFADDTTGLCVYACPTNYFADNSTGRCLVYCSANYFADQSTGLCVLNCPSGYYRSTVTRSCVRTCPNGYYSDPASLNCSTRCSAGRYGDSLTGTCNTVCTMPNFGDSSVGLCVAICSAGLYADNYTQNCVVATSCYSNTIGDPTTNRCINPQGCPSSPYMFADLTGKICTTRCTTTWGDTVSRQCVASCPWNPQTYVTWANTDTRQCLTQCPTLPLTYADNQTRTCTTSCSQPPAVTYPTFADPTSRSCVTICPTGFVSDPATLTCVKACSTIPNVQFYFPQNGSCVNICPTNFYADKSKLTCVSKCSTSPLYFAYSGNNTCVSVCPSPLFGDVSTGQCVPACPQTTRTYADNSTNLCVVTCPYFPTPTFGQTLANGTRACVPTCSVGLFADPVTRTCVLVCNISLGYYGELISPLRTCVTECNINYFANNATAQCVSQCPSSPAILYGDPVSKTCQPRCPPHLYGNPNNNLCVVAASCPTNSFGDSYSNLCVKLCPANQSTFGDSSSHRCLQVCPEAKYADNTTRLCSSGCSAGLYKDISTKTCVKACPSLPKLYADSSTMTCSSICNNSYFSYDPTRVCLSICPSTPPYYGDYQTYRCVTSCPNKTYIFTNNTFRGCVSTCPIRVYSALYSVTMYADNSTWSCVTLCPNTANLYNFAHPTIATIRTCVTTCPVISGTYYFAQNSTQSCVTRCPSAILGTYGDTFTLKCVTACSRDQYRDNTTSRCVYQCSPGYFADNTTWSCQSGCPAGYVAETQNRTCSLHCPTNYYADNVTRYCQPLCDTETYLYSDNTTWTCVSNCTGVPDYFADPNTKLCSLACTGGLFADPPTRTCLPAINCSTGLIADPSTGRCVNICPIEVPSFLDTPSNLCTEFCQTGLFADNSTMKCVEVCPSSPDYFAYNHSTLQGVCVLFCPLLPTPYYRHSPTRECLLTCPGPNYFRDTTTLKCVTACPPYYFAEIVGQICVANCSANSKYGYDGKCYSICPAPLNADPTSFLCLQTCPFGYFSENGVCVINCTLGYADPFLKACVTVCSPDYFAYTPTLQCRQNCQPQFKYIPDKTCQTTCPVSDNITTNLYKDPATYSCTNLCLPGWFADNITRSCTQTCSSTLFADSSTGLCVTKCPSSPDFYGFNRVCYYPCPAQTPALFAEITSRTCMPVCPNGTFADSFVRRCVTVCTNVQFSYLGPPPVCLTRCPSPLYSFNDTKTCIPLCPNGTYGENGTRACIPHCPPGSFADSHLNLCVAECNASIPQFADASTQSCVTVCPTIPSFYGQFVVGIPKCVPACGTAGWFTLNTTRMCVQHCPSPFFADPVTSDCAYFCQINQAYFADNKTRTCSPTCPNVTVNNVSIPTYADPSTRTCVWKCPVSPALYGYNATNTCMKKCPLTTYGDSDTRVCLRTCFFNISVNGQMKYTYAQNTTTFCVRQCPPGSWADNLTYTCVSLCSLGTYADSSTWKCVLMCPSNPISFAYGPNRTCIYSCPVNYFASDVGRVCMNNTCPIIPYFYYRDYQNHQCVLKCTYPFFGQISSQSCVTNCSYGYYVNLGSMTCAACPSACLTCINSANCTNCKVGLYHFQGQCVATCPTFPIFYFMYDLSFICLSACPAPYFGFNLTGRCELTCPSGYFKNMTTSSCQACPYGCNSCFVTNCTSCISGFVYVSKYGTCSQTCSATLPYFLSRKCVAACPSGTFLLDDLVTCQKCSSICAECAVLATNCTSCQGAFWYNYNCVSQCPSSYFVNRNNFCKQCSSSPGACALPPLSYYFYTQQVNYQLYIIVVFNRPVSLTAQQFPTVAQLMSSNGPIKSSQYSISQTSAAIYSLKIFNSASLNQMSITLSFNPGSIYDGSGVGLSTTTVTQPIGAVTSVSAQTQAQAAALSNKTNVLGLILMGVLVLMMIRCSYPQIVLLDLLQYIHLHAYLLLSPMPYLFMQVVATLKNLNFVFLPPLYTNSSPDVNSPYFNFQEDTTFIGNCQPFVFFLAIFGGSYLIIWALSSRINKCNWLRRKAKVIFKNRMRFSFLHEIFYYTEYYVVFFALYQFTGANSNLDASSTNLAAAVIVFLLYMVWLVWLTYLGAKYRTCLDKVPQKYRFLVYQESQFPLQIPLRALFKLIVGCVLISGDVSVQLVLLMVFNIVYLIYTLCYHPSKSKITNFLNAFITTAFIVCEIVFFIYDTTNKSTINQNLFSLVLLAIMGLMIILVLLWVVYRFIKYIREDIMGIKAMVEQQKPKFSSKYSKVDYQKIKISDQKKLSSKKVSEYNDKNIFDKDKEMNISELNFQDQQEQMSDGPQITPEQAIQMFTYHHVPKKTEALAKYQRELLGVKEIKKKTNQPIVLEIDEDQLINQKKLRLGSRQSNRFKVERRNRGQLRIQGEDSLNELQDIHLMDNNSSVKPNEEIKSEKKQCSLIEVQSKKDNEEHKVIQEENIVIQDKIQVQVQSQQSNYWTRRNKNKVQKKAAQLSQNRVFQDLDGQDMQLE